MAHVDEDRIVVVSQFDRRLAVIPALAQVEDVGLKHLKRSRRLRLLPWVDEVEFLPSRAVRIGFLQYAEELAPLPAERRQ